MLATVSAWKNSVNATVGGVGMLIGPRALKTFNSIKRIQPRMMAATFNGNPKATIISCYSPTNVSEETELVTFYKELSSLVHSILKHNLLAIGGNMNAQIGKNRNNKYSLHNIYVYIYMYIYLLISYLPVFMLPEKKTKKTKNKKTKNKKTKKRRF